MNNQREEACRADTVPPPSGAADAYSALTRVAPQSEDLLASIRRDGKAPTFAATTADSIPVELLPFEPLAEAAAWRRATQALAWAVVWLVIYGVLAGLTVLVLAALRARF